MYCERDVRHLCALVGGYDSSSANNNYSQGGPGYSSQAANHAGATYVGYSGSQGPSRGGNGFTVQLNVTFLERIFPVLTNFLPAHCTDLNI